MSMAEKTLVPCACYILHIFPDQSTEAGATIYDCPSDSEAAIGDMGKYITSILHAEVWYTTKQITLIPCAYFMAFSACHSELWCTEGCNLAFCLLRIDRQESNLTAENITRGMLLSFIDVVSYMPVEVLTQEKYRDVGRLRSSGVSQV